MQAEQLGSSPSALHFAVVSSEGGCVYCQYSTPVFSFLASVYPQERQVTDHGDDTRVLLESWLLWDSLLDRRGYQVADREDKLWSVQEFLIFV